MNAITQTENALVAAAPRQQFDLSPQTFDQALTFAKYLAESDLVPKDFRGRPGNCLIAMQWGSELGLKPLQALQNLAIINGRPALWGDAVIALVRASPLCEWIIETDDGTTATCTVKRRGEPEQARTFSMEDAKLAGLLGKAGPWTQYPKRMRQNRARGFALRDVFPDVLRGMPVAEELMDTPAERSMGPVDEVRPAFYPEETFAANLPKWHKVIADGRKTPEDIIAMAQTKHPLTDAQKTSIGKWRKPAADAPPAEPAPPAPPAPPRMSYAQVADKLNAADSLDALADAASLIGTVDNEAHRAELVAIHDRRQADLEAAQ